VLTYRLSNDHGVGEHVEAPWRHVDAALVVHQQDTINAQMAGTHPDAKATVLVGDQVGDHLRQRSILPMGHG
jgi:hypothetical protein